jgi:hypothetical protein
VPYVKFVHAVPCNPENPKDISKISRALFHFTTSGQSTALVSVNNTIFFLSQPPSKQHNMPPKKKRKQGITTVDTIAALDRVSSTTFSRGAIEALRLCHAQFISLLGDELALLCSDTATVTLQPSHVDECLEKLCLLPCSFRKVAFSKPQATTSNNKTAAAAPPPNKKRKQWSAELQQEQETLLQQSKQTMQQQQKK